MDALLGMFSNKVKADSPPKLGKNFFLLRRQINSFNKIFFQNHQMTCHLHQILHHL